MSSAFFFVLASVLKARKALSPKHPVEMSPTIIYLHQQSFLSSILYMSPFNFIECTCILQLSEEINAGLWRSVNLCPFVVQRERKAPFLISPLLLLLYSKKTAGEQKNCSGQFSSHWRKEYPRKQSAPASGKESMDDGFQVSTAARIELQNCKQFEHGKKEEYFPSPNFWSVLFLWLSLQEMWGFRKTVPPPFPLQTMLACLKQQVTTSFRTSFLLFSATLKAQGCSIEKGIPWHLSTKKTQSSYPLNE